MTRNMNDDIINSDKSELLANPNIACVQMYINRVWNENRLTELSIFLQDQYVDHSMPYAGLKNQHGLWLYLNELAKTVRHETEIVEVTAVGELVVCRVRITLISLLAMEISCPATEVFFGYRIFMMNQHKIAQHWEIL